MIPGEWECAVCQLVGCWPARKICFRSNTPKNEEPPAPSRPQRERGHLQRFPQHTAPADPTTRVPRNVPPRNQLRTPNAVQLQQQQQQRKQRMAGPPVDHEALLSLLADLGLSSEVLRQVRERIPVPAPQVKNPPPNTKRLTAIKYKLGRLRMQHGKMVATYERELEIARLAGVKIAANEK